MKTLLMCSLLLTFPLTLLADEPAKTAESGPGPPPRNYCRGNGLEKPSASAIKSEPFFLEIVKLRTGESPVEFLLIQDLSHSAWAGGTREKAGRQRTTIFRVKEWF